MQPKSSDRVNWAKWSQGKTRAADNFGVNIFRNRRPSETAPLAGPADRGSVVYSAGALRGVSSDYAWRLNSLAAKYTAFVVTQLELRLDAEISYVLARDTDDRAGGGIDYALIRARNGRTWILREKSIHIARTTNLQTIISNAGPAGTVLDEHEARALWQILNDARNSLTRYRRVNWYWVELFSKEAAAD